MPDGVIQVSLGLVAPKYVHALFLFLLVAIYIIDISINRGDCLNPTVLDMSQLPRG
jgi:hypothetical protein